MMNMDVRMDPLANFKVSNTDVPLSYWTIKNHAEMREWIRHKIPHMIYNDAFLEIITELEMDRLLELRMKQAKINSESKAKIEEIKDMLHSA
jgi:hypothetical protein